MFSEEMEETPALMAGGWTWRNTVTMVLALAGFGILSYYSLCDTGCSYLRGDVIGIDLKVLGYFFLILVLLFTILKDGGVLRILLAAALGTEVFLLTFQVREEVFCPYCIAFALVILALFAVNHERPSRWKSGYDRLFRSLGEVTLPELGIRRFPLWVSAGLGFALVSLFFFGVTNPPEGLGRHVPVFGQGPVEVRLYSDYFCRPCEALEPRIRPLFEELVRKCRIRFIQVPNHRLTDPYFYRYLVAMNRGVGFTGALDVRHVLYQCASVSVEEAVLDRIFKKLGIGVIPYDTTLTMEERDWMVREDRIFVTPSLVIRKPGVEAGRYQGVDQIEKALRELLEK